MPTTIEPSPAYPPLRRLRFHCEALDPIRLPAYTGSAWRGLLGHCLRESVCVTRQPTCDGCLLRQTCAYCAFFETPPATQDAAVRYTALPHPFVLEPELDSARSVDPGAPLPLGLTLIGPATELVPYLIHAVQRAGERGLGREGGRFALRELTQETALGRDEWQRLYAPSDGALRQLGPTQPTLPAAPANERVTLLLQTPLRLKHHGRFVGPQHLTAMNLLHALITRADTLCRLYGPAGGIDPDPMFAAARNARITEPRLRWHDWTRYSSRQRTRMQLGGLIGQAHLEADGLSRLWPLLWLGQWTHIGKATSFGLGRYRITP